MVARTRWSKELCRLVRQQRREIRREARRRGRLDPRPGEAREADLGVPLARLAASREPDPADFDEASGFLVFIRPLNPTEMAREALHRAGLGKCQACGRMRDDPPPARPSRYCECCDACGLDHVVEYPGLEVGAYPDPDCPRDYINAYKAERRRLKGGVG
jgi:hypothetical protein